MYKRNYTCSLVVSTVIVGMGAFNDKWTLTWGSSPDKEMVQMVLLGAFSSGKNLQIILGG